jgi:hypothetical protein
MPDASVPADAQQPTALEWSFNPWRQDWRRPALLLVICLALAALAGWAFTAPRWWPQAIGWSAMSLALLVGMNALVVLPVRYRLDGSGVTVWFLGVPSTRPWNHYRNAYFHRRLVHLTTLPRPSALDPFRGHALQFDPQAAQGNRAAVEPFIEQHLAPFKGQPEQRA